MRALAEFVMRGRVSAIAVALLLSWVPVITGGVIGLVTLRKGWQEGLIVALWVIMPSTIGLFVEGGVRNATFGLGIAQIISMYCVAVFLRSTVSWPKTLIALVALSCFFGVSLSLAIPNLLIDIQGLFSQAFDEAAKNGEVNEALRARIEALTLKELASYFAYFLAVSTVLGLVVSRWWQAMLYNPGGFRSEFHQLRLTPVSGVVCLLASLYCALQGSEYQYWTSLFGLPLLVAGLGLVHNLLGRYKTGVGPFVALYIALILIDPLFVTIAVIGFLDIWLDLRKRFKPLQ